MLKRFLFILIILTFGAPFLFGTSSDKTELESITSQIKKNQAKIRKKEKVKRKEEAKPLCN